MIRKTPLVATRRAAARRAPVRPHRPLGQGLHRAEEIDALGAHWDAMQRAMVETRDLRR